jgi:hypothetical protein
MKGKFVLGNLKKSSTTLNLCIVLTWMVSFTPAALSPVTQNPRLDVPLRCYERCRNQKQIPLPLVRIKTRFIGLPNPSLIPMSSEFSVTAEIFVLGFGLCTRTSVILLQNIKF